jgi:putative hemolysin
MLARSFDASNTPFVRPAPAAPAAVDADVFPHHPDCIPPGIVSAGSYDVQFAWTRAELHAVQALRYRVFHEELGHRSPAAQADGRDDDGRDPWFHHLMIVHRDSGAVVGTYRLQTAIMAATRYGFYSASLFELGAMPGSVLQQAVEVGRAAVDPQHRSGRVLQLLWRGLARYLRWNSKRYLFGCCSIDGTEARVAQDSWRILHARRALHDRILVRPRAEVCALADDGRARPLIDAPSLDAPLPPLFDGYLSLGGRVCGAPAVDRDFGTTDYLVLLDIDEMPERAARTLLG